MFRRVLSISAALMTWVSPAAFGQGLPGSVTTAPFGAGAPALALPVLCVLVLALAVLGLYRLRRGGTGATVALVVVAVTMLATIGYAVIDITISGTECLQPTTTMYEGDPLLKSECPNPIRITDLQCSTTPQLPDVPSFPECTLGQTLNNGDQCVLPFCGNP